MSKLTKRFIKSLRPDPARERWAWDDELPGFAIRVWPSGRKMFLIQYRNAQGRTRRMNIGKFEPLSAEQARREAQRLLAEVAQGHDPAEIRDGVRTAPTVDQVAERYMVQHARVEKKPLSVEADERMFRLYILPALGGRKISDVNRADVFKLHHELEKTPIRANRILALLSHMFNLAEKWGLRPDGSNPCRHVKRYRERKRERYLSGEELARLGEVLNRVEHDCSALPGAVTAIRLLILTGARLSEILGLKWEYVDMERAVLKLPDSKTGAKLIPLGQPAIEVLENTPRVAGNPHVCPGRKPGGRLVSLQKTWVRIRTQAEFPDLRLHDLRHSFGSVGAGAGLGLPILGKLLGHAKASTTERYAHVDTDPLRVAADLIAGKIDMAMKQPLKPKVVSFTPDRARSGKGGA